MNSVWEFPLFCILTDSWIVIYFWCSDVRWYFGFIFIFIELKVLPFFPKFVWLLDISCEVLIYIFWSVFFVFSSQKLKLIEGILFVFLDKYSFFFFNYLLRGFCGILPPLWYSRSISNSYKMVSLSYILIWTFTSVNFPANTQLIDPVKFWYVVFWFYSSQVFSHFPFDLFFWSIIDLGVC